ncbi:hypothetical protein HYS00_04260 [Candidatus Microgenomates bacterium]|nr:hypothetical protein [Candidatus Microgenomates bacterium]
MKPKKNRNIFTDTLEVFTEPVKPIPKDIAKGVGSLVDINAFLYGKSTDETPEKAHEKSDKIIHEYGLDKKSKQEHEAMESNHTPLDVRALQEKHQTESIRKRLFNLVKEDEKKAAAEIDQEDKQRKQHESQEAEQKQHDKQQAATQPEEDAHGKSKAKLGQARKKASTDPHQNFEQKSNKGK